ncbi:MAG: hypothetical protein CFK52_03520 [Chloracidobacterium sp. CP2_5A]|nr:MAG: hypothetical protein CFK52_03520 [Chloracidobacterium sp. CP2_5A]
MRSPNDSEAEAAALRARMLATAGLALSLPMTLVGGVIVGYWLDRWLQTAPLWLALLGSAGLVSGGRLLYRLWRQLG